MPTERLLKKINIAIDGVSGCGKSSTARAVASRLDMRYLDTGAMYRAVTYYLLANGVDIDDHSLVINQLENINLDFRYNNETGISEVTLNGTNREKEIRTSSVNASVSKVSAIPDVRKFLVSQQQKIAKDKGVVMDGRDIGTVVLPNAELKIYMDASPEERASRRVKEVVEKGGEADYDEVLNNLMERDHYDKNRKTDPLKKAKNAKYLDTTELTFDEQVGYIIKMAIEASN